VDDLWIEFVNSDWHDHRGRGDRDRLADPQWLTEWLRSRKLPPLDGRAAAVRSALGALRDLLLRMVHSLVEDGPLRPADLEALNRHLAARPVTTRLEVRDHEVLLRLAPEGGGAGAVVFAIAESFAKFLVEGEPMRLKTCENPNCRWVFYDTTRSRTKRWCSDTCGNLIKVRRFRKEQARARPGNAGSKRRRRGDAAKGVSS
jgi:predicted RNA-binding Zn ribbon-like protein